MMNETAGLVIMFLWMFGAIETQAQSQLEETYTIVKEAPDNTPPTIYGSANLGYGKKDSFLLEQSDNNNPLGNPIVTDTSQNQDSLQQQFSLQTPASTQPQQRAVKEDLPQNPKISSQESPQNINKQIQNTLYESGGRIYDIQSYPNSDIDYIEQPNVGNTITTYPAY